jgi:hypothetical protein
MNLVGKFVQIEEISPELWNHAVNDCHPTPIVGQTQRQGGSNESKATRNQDAFVSPPFGSRCQIWSPAFHHFLNVTN